MQPAIARRASPPLEVVAAVRELHLPAQAYGLVQHVDGLEDAVPLRSDAPLHVDAAVQQRALVVARQQLQVRRERPRLPTREELARFHGVHQKHQLGQREIAPGYGVLNRVALVGLNVHPEVAQRLDVAVDPLALRRNLEFVEPVQQLAHRQAVGLVGLVLQDSAEVEQLQLRLAVVGHIRTSLASTFGIPNSFCLILLDGWACRPPCPINAHLEQVSFAIISAVGITSERIARCTPPHGT